MDVKTRPQPERAAYEIYEELDLGPGGYAVAPSTETKRGVKEAIRKKLKRRGHSSQRFEIIG
jgi:hypothetical protein